MGMMGERIGTETPELKNEGVRMRYIGRRDGLDPALVERSLAELQRVNRLLFGYWPVRRTLLPRLAAPGGPWTPQLVVDLGTGSGDVARHLARAAAARGRRVTVVGIDRKLGHLLAGRRREREERRRGGGAGVAGAVRQLCVVADARALPFADGAADWTLSTLFFHHFEAADNRRILAEMRRAARRAAVVVDLRRSRLGAAVGRLLIPLTGAGWVTRHDGRVSLGRSWPLDRVRELVAGQPVEELRRRFPFRFSLVLPGGR
jgi:SAM-dependent methyltransferase